MNEIQCPACVGRGTIDLSYCGQHDRLEPCPNCASYGKDIQGTMTCPKCHGTGKVAAGTKVPLPVILVSPEFRDALTIQAEEDGMDIAAWMGEVLDRFVSQASWEKARARRAAGT